MGSSIDEEYATFMEKVERTICVDNLSQQVTESVIKASINQFGNVKSVEFIRNYLSPRNIPKAALVEMEVPKQAEEIIHELGKYPFMIGGMPRPVRAYKAKPEMFDKRPRKLGRKLFVQWLKPTDARFAEMKKIKKLVPKHAAEASLLLDEQLKREETLHKEQLETLKAHYKKYELIDGLHADGTAKKLASRYA